MEGKGRLVARQNAARYCIYKEMWAKSVEKKKCGEEMIEKREGGGFSSQWIYTKHRSRRHKAQQRKMGG
ncbi:hypothetical protein M413DRAFT_118800 [Hebeloma cylindrosporum]|uniref:Uncharacterized protein n=1 Tax=Hebeloma cylindrosporum TaxID=76867 RepID=A0A0C2YJF8_HEBCY|nr:hypothetical protein M413DRAFT_118800 [Hebeloma cylindrosporum h7]